MLERGDCERRNFPLPVIDSVICEVCSRFFRRLSDMKRHDRVAERCLPVPMQRGSRQWGCFILLLKERTLKVPPLHFAFP